MARSFINNAKVAPAFDNTPVSFPIENSQQINVFNIPDPIYPQYIETSSTAPGSDGPSSYTALSSASWNSSDSQWEADWSTLLKNIWIGKDVTGMTFYYDGEDGIISELSSLAFQDECDFSKIGIVPVMDGDSQGSISYFDDMGALPFCITDSVRLPEGITDFPSINLCSPTEFASSYNTNYEYSGYPEEWYDGNGALNAWKVRVYLPSTVTEFGIVDTFESPFQSDTRGCFGLPSKIPYLDSTSQSGCGDSTFNNLILEANGSVEFYCFNHSVIPTISGNNGVQTSFIFTPDKIKVFIPQELYSDELNQQEGAWFTYYPIGTETLEEVTEHPSKLTQMVNEAIGVDDLFEGSGNDGELVVPGNPVISVDFSLDSEGGTSDYPDYVSWIGGISQNEYDFSDEYAYTWGFDGEYVNDNPEEYATLSSLYGKDITVTWDGKIIASGMFEGPSSPSWNDDWNEDPLAHCLIGKTESMAIIMVASYNWSVTVLAKNPDEVIVGDHNLSIYLGLPQKKASKKINKKYIPDSDKLEEVFTLFDKKSYAFYETVDFVFLEPTGLSSKIVLGFDDSSSHEFDGSGGGESPIK